MRRHRHSIQSHRHSILQQPIRLHWRKPRSVSEGKVIFAPALQQRSVAGARQQPRMCRRLHRRQPAGMVEVRMAQQQNVHILNVKAQLADARLHQRDRLTETRVEQHVSLRA